MRDGINLARFASKLMATGEWSRSEALRDAVEEVLGEEADPLHARAVTNLEYLPVLPGRLEFAVAIRHALLRSRPQVIAIELPIRSDGLPAARWNGCLRSA